MTTCFVTSFNQILNSYPPNLIGALSFGLRSRIALKAPNRAHLFLRLRTDVRIHVFLGMAQGVHEVFHRLLDSALRLPLDTPPAPILGELAKLPNAMLQPQGYFVLH